MREPIQDGSFQVAIPSDPLEAPRVQELIEQQLQCFTISKIARSSASSWPSRKRWSTPSSTAIRWTAPKRCTVNFRVDSQRIDICINDEGQGFAMDDVPDPMAPENLERPCGRGLLLMRHYMTEVTFHAPGNRLTMSKVRTVNGHCRKMVAPSRTTLPKVNPTVKNKTGRLNSTSDLTTPNPVGFITSPNDPDDAAIPGGQGTPSRHVAALPHGRFLRAFRRRCRNRCQGARPDPHQPRQGHAHGRLSTPPTRKLPAQAAPRRPARGHLRPGRRPSPGQGAGPP